MKIVKSLIRPLQLINTEKSFSFRIGDFHKKKTMNFLINKYIYIYSAIKLHVISTIL